MGPKPRPGLRIRKATARQIPLRTHHNRSRRRARRKRHRICRRIDHLRPRLRRHTMLLCGRRGLHAIARHERSGVATNPRYQFDGEFSVRAGSGPTDGQAGDGGKCGFHGEYFGASYELSATSMRI